MGPYSILRIREWTAAHPAIVLGGYLSALAFSFDPRIIVVVALAAALLLNQVGHQILVIVLATGVASRLPWVGVVGAGAAAWWLVEGRRYSALRDRTSGWVRALSCGTHLAVGILAGLVAAWMSLGSINDQPLLLPFEPPPLEFVAVLICGVAMANALGEEVIWRGALYGDARKYPWGWQMIIQSFSFGAAHYSGIPGGVPGCVLAGIFALMAVAVRRRFGFTQAVFFHAGADLAIFWIVYANADFAYVVVQ